MSERARKVLPHRVPDRWMAEIFYRGSLVSQTVAIEEIEDLDEIVENGPDWNTIDRIVITLNRPSAAPTKGHR